MYDNILTLEEIKGYIYGNMTHAHAYIAQYKIVLYRKLNCLYLPFQLQACCFQ